MASTAGSAELLAVGLGAHEQHGPHLPLDTDTVIASALVSGLAAARGVRVAPTLPYGSSGEHAGFAGTLSIGRDALRRVVVELARSHPGPVLFVCAHGGNAEPLAAALTEADNAFAWSPAWGGDAHAGRTETSLMLALAPERVGAERPVGNTEPLAALMPVLRTRGVRAVSPNGVLGDARGASAAEGRALLAAAVAELVAFADAVAAPLRAAPLFAAAPDPAASASAAGPLPATAPSAAAPVAAAPPCAESAR